MHGTIAAVILAGGGGRRLGGVDKALLPLAGQALLAHVLARLRPQTNRILLSANGDPARFAHFGLPVVPDLVADRGPLGGIAAAAAACRHRWPAVRWLATVPVDTPLLPEDLIERLGKTQATSPGKAAVAVAGGRRHWAIALWPIDEAVALADRVEQAGLRRLEEGLNAIGWQTAEFPDARAFANINNEQDFEDVTRLLREL